MQQYELNEIRSFLEGKDIVLAGEKTSILNIHPIRFDYSDDLFLIADTKMGFICGIDLILLYNKKFTDNKKLMNLIEPYSGSSVQTEKIVSA